MTGYVLGPFAALPRSKALSPLPANPILSGALIPREILILSRSPARWTGAVRYVTIRGQAPCGHNSIGVRCYFAAWGLPLYKGGDLPGNASVTRGASVPPLFDVMRL
jgi:hypothetical protein